MNTLYPEYFDVMDGSFDEHRDKVELSYEVFEYLVPETYNGYYDK
jgi:hypothetical protein